MAARAFLAVLLTIGFYLLAIGLAIALLAVPYLEWTDLHRLNLRITIFCLAGAAIILFSILPTVEHFRAPGERADPQSHPRLFAELGAIATAVGEPLPEEVYLVQDLNAAVRQRGGIMGLGGRRVMLLGEGIAWNEPVGALVVLLGVALSQGRLRVRTQKRLAALRVRRAEAR